MKNKILIIIIILICGVAKAQDNFTPIEFTYKNIGIDSLKAYVFFPKDIADNDIRPTIAVFHGGGWAMGEPSWGFGYAKKYAKLGMVAMSVEYRISDKESITPIDAMEDTKDFFIWARENANKLKINKDSIAAFGWSAGGHLVTSDAVFAKYTSDFSISSKPNALILQSPAVSPVPTIRPPASRERTFLIPGSCWPGYPARSCYQSPEADRRLADCLDQNRYKRITLCNRNV